MKMGGSLISKKVKMRGQNRTRVGHIVAITETHAFPLSHVSASLPYIVDFVFSFLNFQNLFTETIGRSNYRKFRISF